MGIIFSLVLNSVIAGSIYALVALGFNLIYGTTKFFNLAHGAMAVIGGYAVFYFSQTLDLNLFLSVPIGILLAGLIGYLLDKLIFSRLRRKKVSNMAMMVASMGAFMAIQSIIAIIFGSQFRSLNNGSLKSNIVNFGGSSITQIQIVILATMVLTAFGMIVFFKKTMFGKSVRAIGDDPKVAEIVGINTNKVIGWVFFIGSSIAGLSGILIGFDTGIEPAMGMGLLLKGVIASIVGGIGNIYGGVAGAFLLAFLENFGIWKISGEWKDTIAFGLLILFLLFRPQGIFKK